jgi:hypothetical protein
MSHTRIAIVSRAWRKLATMAGAVLVSAVPAQAQTVPPSAAPVEWVRYAESATASITTWLESDSEAAQRLRAYLDSTRPAGDQPTPPLQIKVWVDAGGTVSRIDFTPFAHEEANGDLRGLIVGRQLPGPPPPDMLQPIRIAVQLDPAPAPVSGGAGARTPPATTI